MIRRSLSLCVFASVVAAPAVGQEARAVAREEVVEEIIVTAQKREQRAADVGIAMSVLGAEALGSLALRESTEITAQAPNLLNVSFVGPGMNASFAIRGVTMNDFNDGTEAPVATYVDEVYLVPLGAASFPPFDLNRVEVLRGPQGTLFGRNTTGGIVHFVTQRPDPSRREADAEVEYGSRNSLRLTAHVNQPIDAGTALRLSAVRLKSDPWIRNTAGQADAGEQDSEGFRAQIGRTGSGPLSGRLKYEYAHGEGHAWAYRGTPVVRDPVTGLVLQPLAGQTGNSAREADNGSPTFIRGTASHTIVGTLSYDAGDFTIDSVSGFNRYTRKAVEDCEGSPAFLCSNDVDAFSEQHSQEVRLSGRTGGTQWTVGAFALTQESRGNYNAPLFLQANNVPFLVVHARYALDLESYAAFADVERAVSDDTAVILGLRWSRDEKDFAEVLRQYFTNTRYDAVWPHNPNGFVETARLATLDFRPETVGNLSRREEDSVAAKLQINHRPDADTLLYASIRRGVKAGGFNNGYVDIATPLDRIPYRPETVIAYEAGVKTDLVPGRLHAEGAVFHYDYSDYQALTFANLGSFIANRDAKLHGAELELTARPMRGLQVSLGGGLLDTTVYDVPTGPPANRTLDREMILAPSWNVNGLVRYTTALGAGEAGVQVDFKVVDDFQSDILNSRAVAVPGYGTANLRLDYRPPDDRWRAAFIVKNLFNSQHRISGFDQANSFGNVNEMFAAPRWIGMSLGLRLGD